MPLNDFIKQQQESIVFADARKSEFEKYLVNVCKDAQIDASEEKYNEICKEIAKEVACGKQSVSGFCMLGESHWLQSKLPGSYAVIGTETQKEALTACGLLWVNSYDDYTINFYREVPTRGRTVKGTPYPHFLPYAKKMIRTKTCEGFETELRRMLTADGISVSFAVAVMAIKGHGSKRTEKIKEYIDFDQEYTYGLLKMDIFVDRDIILRPVARYSYTHK